jgi:hypothetical protein
MKKTKEECLLMNGIMSFDLGKNESKFFNSPSWDESFEEYFTFSK